MNANQIPAVKTAVVTGAGSPFGLGRTVARTLAEGGWHVALIDNDEEGLAKVGELPGARWHLIGPLQSNKARRALEAFDSIQTVDSVDLARRLDRLVPEVRPDRRYPVLVQVNVDLDPAKSGFQPDAVAAVIDELVELPHLEIRGLMTVGRLAGSVAEARATFSGLRELSGRLRGQSRRLGHHLSMGMTDDFELAVEEGATIVRVGRAIFGEREHDHDHHHAAGA